MKALVTVLAIALLALFLTALALAAQKEQFRSTSPNAQSQVDDEAKRGERVFHIHCGNCHQSPDQLPPRVDGTVLRHMRVRAMLTPEDERLLMKYLSPQ